MKTQSAKAKGRAGQKDVAKILQEHFQGYLAKDDIVSRPMGSPGSDIMLSPKAQSILPWDIEVKRGKAFNLIQACKQAADRSADLEPVAFGRYDKDKTWYVCMDADYFLGLVYHLHLYKGQ